MSKRNYNVFFNAHTVSGIIISFLLYVIFFAGAFALFKDEITVWEEGERINRTAKSDIDFDGMLTKLDNEYNLLGRDLQFRFGLAEDHVSLFMSGSKDSLASEKAKESHYFITNIHTYETETYAENYSLGEFLYRLHFFQQLPGYGIYIAGIVSLLFLFAIVTGVIVHWKKIISNLFNFNPKSTLKRIWTDAHTALGTIGLPFQLLFAVTGAYFCLSIFVLAPANIIYKNDRKKLMADLRPGPEEEDWIKASQEKMPSYNDFIKQSPKWENFELNGAMIKNYGGVNMHYIIKGKFPDHHQITGTGRITKNAYSGEIIEEKHPSNSNYIESVQEITHRLHYGDFGGISLKIIYFLLALLTCFVIISGVLIWIEARNRRNMTIRQRLYTAGVGRTYLSICLSMLPVTALAFIFVKFSHGHFQIKQSAIYAFYFLTWMAFILIFRLKKDNYFTNKMSLLLGGIFGLFVPIVNGAVTGNWIWVTIFQDQKEIVTIDLLWVIIASLCFGIYFSIKPSIKEQSTYAKYPL